MIRLGPAAESYKCVRSLLGVFCLLILMLSIFLELNVFGDFCSQACSVGTGFERTERDFRI